MQGSDPRAFVTPPQSLPFPRAQDPCWRTGPGFLGPRLAHGRPVSAWAQSSSHPGRSGLTGWGAGGVSDPVFPGTMGWRADGHRSGREG